MNNGIGYLRKIKEKDKIPNLLNEINFIDRIIYDARFWNIELKKLKKIKQDIIDIQKSVMNTYSKIEKYFIKNNINYW